MKNGRNGSHTKNTQSLIIARHEMLKNAYDEKWAADRLLAHRTRICWFAINCKASFSRVAFADRFVCLYNIVEIVCCGRRNQCRVFGRGKLGRSFFRRVFLSAIRRGDFRWKPARGVAKREDLLGLVFFRVRFILSSVNDYKTSWVRNEIWFLNYSNFRTYLAFLNTILLSFWIKLFFW